MANEISVNILFQAAKAAAGLQIQAIQQTRWDMSGTHHNATVQDFTTTEAAIRKGDVVTVGWVYVQALKSNTADVIIGVKPAGSFIEVMRIQAGMVFAFHCGANDLYAKSASGTQKLDVRLLES
jgi:hypothetical protein